MSVEQGRRQAADLVCVQTPTRTRTPHSIAHTHTYNNIKNVINEEEIIKLCSTHRTIAIYSYKLPGTSRATKATPGAAGGAAQVTVTGQKAGTINGANVTLLCRCRLLLRLLLLLVLLLLLILLQLVVGKCFRIGSGIVAMLNAKQFGILGGVFSVDC